MLEAAAVPGRCGCRVRSTMLLVVAEVTGAIGGGGSWRGAGSRREDKPGKYPPTIGVDRPLYRPLCFFQRPLCRMSAEPTRTPVYRPWSHSDRPLLIDPYRICIDPYT